MDSKMLKRGWQVLCSVRLPLYGLNLALLTSASLARPRHWLVPHQVASTPAAMPAAVDAVQALAPAVAASPGVDWGMRLFSLGLGIAAGALVGAFFSERMQRIRRYLMLGAFGLAALTAAGIGIQASDHMSELVGGVIGAIAAWMLLREQASEQADTTLGSARWANVDELRARGIVQSR
jgi:hypothetical protein